MLSVRAIQSDIAATYQQVLMADATIWPTHHQDVASQQYDADLAGMGFYHSFDPQARANPEQAMNQSDRGVSGPEQDAPEPEM